MHSVQNALPFIMMDKWDRLSGGTAGGSAIAANGMKSAAGGVSMVLSTMAAFAFQHSPSGRRARRAMRPRAESFARCRVPRVSRAVRRALQPSAGDRLLDDMEKGGWNLIQETRALCGASWVRLRLSDRLTTFRRRSQPCSIVPASGSTYTRAPSPRRHKANVGHHPSGAPAAS